NLGLVYEEQGDWDKAIAHHLKSIAINPDDYMVHYNVARVYDLVQDGSKAIAHLRKAESIANKENDEKEKHQSKNLLLDLLQKYNE
ncbi:MAG: tetratricopeptide repeat protein, partial [Nitrospinaceae bacterium]